MAWVRTAATLGLAAMAAGSASAQQRQQVTGPVATYWMSAQTVSGMGAMGMGGPGGGRPNMGAMMGMMMGGRGGGPQHQLTLQLGSSRKPTGAPEAEHLPPPDLGAGQSLPLLTPRAQPTQRVEEDPVMPREYEKPKGRMLIFWGCGERARPGQPVVIDFAQVASGTVPPGLAALSKGLNVTPMRPPSPSRNTTYGEWPNERTRTNVPGNGSLIGEHLVQGTYSPEIKFSLGQNQDFLGPINLQTGDGPQGSAMLNWRTVSNAQAYLATAVGGGDNDTVVLWTSSEVQASAFAMPDYISPGDLSRLVAQKALMAPQTTSCAIPREVVQAAPSAFVQMVAYGGEANFVYPPRPSDPKVAWNQQWAVKVRYRSATSAILGMDMGAMGGGYEDDEDGPPRRGQRPPPRSQQQQPQRPSAGQILRGLGGIGF